MHFVIDFRQCSISYNFFYPDWGYKEGDHWTCSKQVKDYPFYKKKPQHMTQKYFQYNIIIQYRI